MWQGSAEHLLSGKRVRDLEGKVQLIFTSPPFPLNRKKRYGNLNGQDYVDWLARFAISFRQVLANTGSIVIEMGNAWEPGKPVMSTLGLRALLAFQDRGQFQLCQQFICYNPARLPSPAQWVNVERIRVKDAFTHIWWMSPSDRPAADNRRILKAYSKAMLRLLATRKYNAGRRPSEHRIGGASFLRNNRGAIPSNVLTIANTGSSEPYQRYCRRHGLQIHPARMPSQLAEFFIKFLTQKGELVRDPCAGSNTTGAAAERLERKWISIEPTETYITGSCGRFEASSGGLQE